MTISGPAAMMRIYVGDADHLGGRPAYHAIVELLRSRGFAGATVVRGIEGFGAKHQVHTDRILSRALDMPVVIEAVDQEDRLRAVLPELDTMIGDGMIVLLPVEVSTHRSRSWVDPRATTEHAAESGVRVEHGEPAVPGHL